MTLLTSIPSAHFGTLFLVATPIGNLQDMTFRALDVLKSVDYIAAEDTRNSGFLLNHFGINKPLLSLHAFNEEERSRQLIEKLQQGYNIALISDAGTPLMSDPGLPLVQQAREKGIIVTPIPGPCALIAALSASGLPCRHFFFFGFLPAQTHARRKALEAFHDSPDVTIFYEAPHRILALMEDIHSLFEPDRLIGFAKEISKRFEFFFLGTSKEAISWLTSKPEHQKGEFVVMLSGKAKAIHGEENTMVTLPLESLIKKLLQSLPLKQAVSLATDISGEKKNIIYTMALHLKNTLSQHST